MKRETRYLIFGLIAGAVGLAFFLWIFPSDSLEPGDVNQTEDYAFVETEIEDDFPNIEKLHFSHVPITYSYSDSCIGPIVPRIEWAFDILENETEELLLFEEINGNANINFICNKRQNVQAVGEYVTEYTFGRSIIEKLSGSIIDKTSIEFFSVGEDSRPPSCYNFPRLELHEILHSFGLDHIEDNKYSLMYPEAFWEECIVGKTSIKLSTGEVVVPEDKIDGKIISCLKYIYSNGKKGKHRSCKELNFQFEEYYGDCPEGTYPVEENGWGTDWCCPKPNQVINEVGGCSDP